MTTTGTIPGTRALPNTATGWTQLARCVSMLSKDACERILDANHWPHNAMVLLDYRAEMHDLCVSNGAARIVW